MKLATQLPDAATLAGMDSKALMGLENDIAREFMGGVPWLAVAWGLGNLLVWLSLWPLTLMGILPLWVAFPIATLNVMLCYLPSHEAQHDIIARPGEPLRWLNQLVGFVSTIPMVGPYRTLRLTHMEHHKHTNHPDLDPDISSKAASISDFLKASIAKRQPKGDGNAGYTAALERIGGPEAALAKRDAAIFQLGFLAILFISAATGHALEAALLWWLPRHIGQTYISLVLSWAPHHPAENQGRYKDTRAFRSWLGNIGTMGMQFHIIHHLHPRIPLTRTPAAYWALRPILVARECDLAGL